MTFRIEEKLYIAPENKELFLTYLKNNNAQNITCVVDATGVEGNPHARLGAAAILGPPTYQLLKTAPHHSPQAFRTITHALRAKRGG